jgi:hypothetical protein
MARSEVPDLWMNYIKRPENSPNRGIMTEKVYWIVSLSESRYFRKR